MLPQKKFCSYYFLIFLHFGGQEAVLEKVKRVVYPIKLYIGCLHRFHNWTIADMKMLPILDRYIFREIAQSWLAVTAVLLAILLTNQFARVLGDVAKDKLPKDAVFQIIGLTALQYLTFLVPIALFLSIMLGLGRLYRDGEMPAMMACSLGPADIYRPVSWLLIPLAIIGGWLATSVTPMTVSEIERIDAEARRSADLASIEAGRFTSEAHQNGIVYAESVVGQGIVEKVFLQRRQGSNVEVVIAEEGEQKASDDSETRYFVLRNGRRYEGVPGTTNFMVVEFAEHGIPYRLPDIEDTEREPNAKKTRELVGSDDNEEIAELHWRFGIPLATVVLAIIAVPLSRTQPRQGRYSRLIIGLLVFIVYFNLLIAGKAWIEQGRVIALVGLWWVHGGMLIAGLSLLAVQNGWHKRIFAIRKIS
ncbi:MAG: LPS export ABC transporter permease LptF [Woeseia sp.]|nr:LPS export ABC transporter permease LptF [Woeseia sp.]